MKLLPLSACFAAAAAFAADLKDPADVAKEWNQTIEQDLPSAISPTLSGLISSLAAPPQERSVPLATGEAFVPKRQRSVPRPNLPFPNLGPLYDAPSRPPVRRLPPEIPDNALPWLYRDQTYWLVPLGGPSN